MLKDFFTKTLLQDWPPCKMTSFFRSHLPPRWEDYAPWWRPGFSRWLRHQGLRPQDVLSLENKKRTIGSCWSVDENALMTNSKFTLLCFCAFAKFSIDSIFELAFGCDLRQTCKGISTRNICICTFVNTIMYCHRSHSWRLSQMQVLRMHKASTYYM